MARSTRTLRTDLPTDVWDRLADEAAAAGVPLGRYVKNMFIKRDRKRYPDQQSETRIADKKEDQS